MEKVMLKQQKLMKVNILGVVLIILSLYLIFINKVSIVEFTMLFLSGIIITFHSFSFQINKDFKNYKWLHLFGFKVFKQKANIPFPDYISVFSASFKQNNEWNTVSAMGTTSESEATVIKFFYGNKNQTVFKSNSRKLALEKANKLAKMLNIKVLDKIRNSST